MKLGRLAKEYSEASSNAKQIRVSPDFSEDDNDEVAAEELVSPLESLGLIVSALPLISLFNLIVGLF